MNYNPILQAILEAISASKTEGTELVINEVSVNGSDFSDGPYKSVTITPTQEQVERYFDFDGTVSPPLQEFNAEFDHMIKSCKIILHLINSPNPSDIKEGVKILGVTGTLVDTGATAEPLTIDLVPPSGVYKEGLFSSVTIPETASEYDLTVPIDCTESPSSQQFAESIFSRYAGINVQIAETNTPNSADIKKGVKICGVTGTLEAGSNTINQAYNVVIILNWTSVFRSFEESGIHWKKNGVDIAPPPGYGFGSVGSTERVILTYNLDKSFDFDEVTWDSAGDQFGDKMYAVSPMGITEKTISNLYSIPRSLFTFGDAVNVIMISQYPD